MKTYSIKQISDLFQIPATTLRYYEDMGLLPAVPRNASHQRVYSQTHIDRLNGIACFKRTGLSLADIQHFFTYETDLTAHIDDIIALMENHETELNQKLQELESDLAHIHQKVLYYNGIKKAIDSNEPWPCWDQFH